MSSIESRLNEYKEKTKIDGEDLVRNVFPKRVFEMEEVLSSELFVIDADKTYSEINIPYPKTWPIKHHSVGDCNTCLNNLTEDGPIAASKLLKLSDSTACLMPSGCVPYNSHIKAMVEKTKPCLTRLMMEAQIVRLWVQYNIPRIEDGNNFGVGIQEEVLSEASSIERDACTFLDQITRYYASRGKLVGKVANFPLITDYRECIRDMDEKQAITMRYIIMEIRNHYATLHDIIMKNIDRIKTPRSNNAITMY
ncbi:unnamed protein product [Dicrocoelium dendriticum]|nr:unnamed protein product [Dicrocoelium dendriticum]